MPTKIETPRLILRAFEVKDAKDLLKYLAKPMVNCFASDKISTLDEALIKIHKRQADNDYIAVCLKETDQLIGEIFFTKDEPDTFSVGWNFNKDFQGKGYAYESTYAFLDFLFNHLNARRIYAYVEEDNYPSQKLCERLKFRKEGCFIEYISFVKSTSGIEKYENTLQYAILKKEWNAT